MKKYLLFLICFATICSTLTACGTSSENEPNQKEPEITQQSAEQETAYSAESSVPSSTTTTATEIELPTTTTASETTTQMTSVSTTTPTLQTTTSSSTNSPEIQTSTTAVLPEEKEELNTVQENSIAWLNYLAMLSQEINSSKNSKMYLEEAYAALINNTNPENVDEPTESQLVSLLDIIEKYRIIATKRERLQYIYEQNQAKAIKEAIPNPVALLSATSSLDPKKMIASVVYMAVDSYSSYSAYNNEINQEYLKDGWELDDEAAENLHNSRTRAFTYMIEIVRQYDLPGELALNESAIEKFVECKNNTNVHQQIQFLESNEKTYKSFGNYWLLLAECYYNNGEYQKCLDSVEEYEQLHSGIFRKDYNLAKTLPLAIASAAEIQTKSEYVSTAEKYIGQIISNTESDEWQLRYFAATIYTDLYSRTKNRRYLQSAYELALNNVNYLTAKQSEINSIYIADVKEITIPKDATKDEKKKIKAYNKAISEKRETELPEIYEPLAINCDLLFSVADKLDLTQSEKDRIDGILSGSETPVFLTKPVNNLFSFSSKKISADASFDKDELVLPVYCVSEGAKIKVTVSSGDKYIVYEDWKIDEVERPKKKKDDFSKFKVTYTSEKAEDCIWHKDSKVKIEIFNGDYSNSEPYVINFKVSNFVSRKIGWDTVEFEQVM